MERKETSIKELLEKRINKTLTNDDIKDLWYDWFCRDSSLVNNGKFDPEKTYTFFKNNCPLRGCLYDDFRICDIETGDVIWAIIPKSGHYVDEGRAILCGRINNFEGPVVEGSWKDIVNYSKS